MICIVALIVFGVLGIFSTSHRLIAREAFECVFRRLTLRKCQTGLDKRLKAQITGKLMRKSPGLGKWTYRNFEILSWVFLVLLLVSLFYTGQAVYFFAKYGNCNGPNSDKFCIFDPLNTMGGSDADVCAAPGVHPDSEPVFTGNVQGMPYYGDRDAEVTVIEFGCFSCPNTKNVVPTVKKVLEEYGDRINFVYIDFPLAHHDMAWEASFAADCVWLKEPDKYWDYHFELFERQNDLDESMLISSAEAVGVDIGVFSQCLDNGDSEPVVDADYAMGLQSGVYGTPTFFINDDVLVGAVSYSEFSDVLDAYLEQ